MNTARLQDLNSKKMYFCPERKKKQSGKKKKPWWITFGWTVDSLVNNGWCTVTQRSCFWSQCHLIYWCSFLRKYNKMRNCGRVRGKFTKPQQQFFSDLAQNTKTAFYSLNTTNLCFICSGLFSVKKVFLVVFHMWFLIIWKKNYCDI